MWRRMAKKERNEYGWRSWSEIKLAKSRPQNRDLLLAPYATLGAKRKYDDDDDDVFRKLLSALGNIL